MGTEGSNPSVSATSKPDQSDVASLLRRAEISSSARVSVALASERPRRYAVFRAPGDEGHELEYVR